MTITEEDAKTAVSVEDPPPPSSATTQVEDVNTDADTIKEAPAPTPESKSKSATFSTSTESTTASTESTTSTTTTCPNSNWSKDKLMGKSVSFKGLSAGSSAADSAAGITDTDTDTNNNSQKKRLSLSKRRSATTMPAPKDEEIDPALWGRPGHLSESDADTYLKFKEVVDMRGGDFKDTVYCFGEEEGEVYALCRWCRARKFVYDDIMMMVEEATKCRAVAKKADFYPDPKSALGCDTAVYAAQYPQVYSGFAKNGSPMYFSKVGLLNIEAIECVTTVSSIVKYHWYVMMRDFATRLHAHKEADPQFQKFECVCVMDLANLTMAQLGSKSLAIIKEQSAIDSLCFPETLNKMYIVNSPLFFSATWGIIKGWLDPRTASKVEVISSRKTWEKALLEYADVDQLPSDYGGTGPNTKDTMEMETFTGNLKRIHTEVLYVRGHSHITYDIVANEELEVAIFTRSTAGAKWTISEAKNKHGTTWISDVETKHVGDDLELPPTHVKLTQANIKGPASIKLNAKSLGSRWSSEKFLVVINVFNP